MIYGHNGSGKSTFAELVLGLAEGASPTTVVWEDDSRRRSSVDTASALRSARVAVFTRRWVEDNLSEFLDGQSASAIVTLGKDAINAKDEEKALVDEIRELRERAEQVANMQKIAADKVSRLARLVQDRIISELREFDYDFYSRSRFSITRVSDYLRNYNGKFPDVNAHAEALKRLGEREPSMVSEVPPLPVSPRGSAAAVAALLSETPTRVAIAALDGNPPAQAWVEQGVRLHVDVDHCLYCDGEISQARRQELARHFDESWLRIRRAAQDALTASSQEREALLAWRKALPAGMELDADLQPAYRRAVEVVDSEVALRIEAFSAVEGALRRKVDDPSSVPDEPDMSAFSKSISTTILAQAVSEHNERVRRHGELSTERRQSVFDHIVGSNSNAFRELEALAGELGESCETAERSAALAERRLDAVRQEQFTTKHMADTLTNDLARVYGKSHLSIAVTPDGKSYACRRGDKPGTHLSEGERTTLSLLYFLRKLEDEQTPGGDRSQRIVVIDDPSSSLDREALFATHQWLVDTLKDFGQFIVLTHDFSLLRLFIKSQASAWRRTAKKIKDGDVDEIRFPKVSFLEMYASAVDGPRRTRVGRLPQVLLHNTSEYAYLFSMVMKGIVDSEDHERLFLLPNAARRVLEVFASYKAPHRTNFLAQLEALIEAQPGEPYRDVYDFCNRYSHGEGSESVDVLDARAVHGQIRRCMEFLKAADSVHFDRMCSATNVDAATLA